MVPSAGKADAKRFTRRPAQLSCISSPTKPQEVPMVETGQAAPDFTLTSHEGDEVSLSQFKGDKWLVVHTFPAAFTGG